jgi:hypothetical protein
VDHRWRLAVERVRNRPRRHPPPPDEWVDQAQRFVTAVVACREETERDAVAGEFPAIEAAFRLRTSPNKMARAAVEARLLAGLSINEVAAACGLPPAVVNAYEQLFFTVTDRLNDALNILEFAVGEPHFDRSLRTEEDLDVLLKWAAYTYGPLLLEELVAYFATGCKVPERLDGLTREQLEEVYRKVLMEFLVRAWLIPTKEAMQMLQLEQLRQELQALLDGWQGPTVTAGVQPIGPAETREPLTAPRRLPERTPALRVALEAWDSTWHLAVLLGTVSPDFGSRRGRCKKKGVDHGVGRPR